MEYRKNPSFHTDFKNVHLKSAPESFLPEKSNCLGLWLKLFIGSFFAKVKCTFLQSE